MNSSPFLQGYMLSAGEAYLKTPCHLLLFLAPTTSWGMCWICHNNEWTFLRQRQELSLEHEDCASLKQLLVIHFFPPKFIFMEDDSLINAGPEKALGYEPTRSSIWLIYILPITIEVKPYCLSSPGIRKVINKKLLQNVFLIIFF